MAGTKPDPWMRVVERFANKRSDQAMDYLEIVDDAGADEENKNLAEEAVLNAWDRLDWVNGTGKWQIKEAASVEKE